MNFALSYLEIDRLGEIEGLRANDISPMHDLAPVIGEMKKSIDPQALEKLDDLLSEQKLLAGGKAAPEICGLLKALFAPEKCFHTRMNEPGGCSATYYIPFEGVWVRLDAIRGQLKFAFPLPEDALKVCLSADVRVTLKGENIRLLAERRETDITHSAVITTDEKGYAFIGSVVDKKKRSCTEYIHSFAKTEENIAWIADMLSGKRDFVLSESEQEQENTKPAEKRSHKKFWPSLIIRLVMAFASAVITAVYANTLFSRDSVTNQIFAALFFYFLITAVSKLITEIRRKGVGKRLKTTLGNMVRLKPPALWFFIAAVVLALFLPYAFVLAFGLLLFTSALSGENSLLLGIKNALTKGKNPERNGKGLAAFTSGLIVCGLIICALTKLGVPTLYGVIDGSRLKNNTTQMGQVDKDDISEPYTSSDTVNEPENMESRPNSGDGIVSADTDITEAAQILTAKLIEYAGNDRAAFEKLFRNTDSSVIDQYYNTSYDTFKEYGKSLIAIAADDGDAVWFTALYYQIPENYPAEKEKAVYLSTIMTCADDGWKIEWNDDARARLQSGYDDAGFSYYGLEARDQGYAWAKFFIPFDLNSTMIFYDGAVMCKLAEMYMDEGDNLNLTFYVSNGTDKDVNLANVDFTVTDGDIQLFSKSFDMDLYLEKSNACICILTMPAEQLDFASWSSPRITDFTFSYDEME